VPFGVASGGLLRYSELPLYPGQPAAVNGGIGRFPERPNGTSVLVFPGGAYHRVCVDKEGLEIARVLAGWGITTAVLTYRQPGGVFADPPPPLVDARRSLVLLAENAGAWRLDLAKLVLMGFSAGGHLALLTLKLPGPAGLVPRYAVLGYPVVSLVAPLVHGLSRDNLLGPNAPEERLQRYAGHTGLPRLQGVFLIHADDDGSVPVGNSELLAEAWPANGTPCELLRHPTGGHGFGWGPWHGYAAAPDWARRLRAWLEPQGLATPPAPSHPAI